MFFSQVSLEKFILISVRLPVLFCFLTPIQIGFNKKKSQTFINFPFPEWDVPT